MRDASLALAELVAGEPVEREVLQTARWRVARELLRLLPVQDRLVYARLDAHPDPAVRATALRYRAETATIYAAYEAHSERWTLDAALANWATYRFAVGQQAAAVVARFEREEAELLPLLADAPALPDQRSPDDRNWAGDGWAFRERLEMPETLARPD